MSAQESQAQPTRPYPVAGVTMRDLLASCAAANLLSVPPRKPDPEVRTTPREHREAA